MKLSAVLVPVMSILGVGALGVGGYNFATTGCPLGTPCDAKVTTVSQTSGVQEGGCCSQGLTQVADKSDAACCKGEATVAAGECCKQTGTGCGDKEAVKEGEVVQASQKSEGHCPMSGDCSESKASCPSGEKPATQAEEKNDGSN